MTGLLVCVSTDTAADNRRIVVVFLPLSLFIAFFMFCDKLCSRVFALSWTCV